MRIDMHIHTTASDGQFTPEEVVEKCRDKRLALMAITDHDTILGIEAGKRHAAELGVRFISGIEISTQDVEEVHILGYGIDPGNEALQKSCGEYARSRSERGDRICDYLKKKRVCIDLQEVKEIAGAGSLGRPHFAEWLVRHGYVRNKQAAFVKYLDTDEFHAETDRKLPIIKEAIDLIHGAGGLAVMAHPGLLKMPASEQEAFIERLAAEGLDGVECYYGKHTGKQTCFYLDIVRRLGLKTSCGSDFHGELVKPGVRLGMKFPDENAGDLIIN